MAGSTYSGRAEGPTCRVCQKGALEILVAIKHTGVPHGLDGHQFQHHTSTLFRCERCGVGELHVCDHDCFSSYDADDRYEPWDLEWNYQLDTPDMLKLAALLRELCPAPRDPSCTCAAHAGLRSSHLSARGRDLVPISLRMKDGVPTLEPKPK